MNLLVRLHRAGLAPAPIVLLEHRGRRTGLVRWTILEAVARAPGEVLVVSGRGERADWVRNVRREPRVRLAVGRAPAVPARACVLDTGEGARRVSGVLRTRVLARLTGRPPVVVRFALR